MKTEFTWDEKTRIGVVLQGPSGDVLIHDDLLKTNTIVNHLELVYNRLPDNLVQHTVERFYSKRWYIVQDYVQHIVWRQSILGEYAERYGAFVRALKEATPGLDDSSIYANSRLFDYGDRARYYQMDFTESARMVYDNGETPYTEYMMRAQLKGVDFYTEEEYAVVKFAFENREALTTNN